jgi:hypothetical protein
MQDARCILAPSYLIIFLCSCTLFLLQRDGFLLEATHDIRGMFGAATIPRPEQGSKSQGSLD